MNAVLSNRRGAFMAVLTIRNLPAEVHRALRRRAALHRRSTEAEVRAILEEAVRPQSRLRIGSRLAEIGAEVGGFDMAIARDHTPPEPPEFG